MRVTSSMPLLANKFCREPSAALVQVTGHRTHLSILVGFVVSQTRLRGHRRLREIIFDLTYLSSRDQVSELPKLCRVRVIRIPFLAPSQLRPRNRLALTTSGRRLSALAVNSSTFP